MRSAQSVASEVIDGLRQHDSAIQKRVYEVFAHTVISAVKRRYPGDNLQTQDCIEYGVSVAFENLFADPDKCMGEQIADADLGRRLRYFLITRAIQRTTDQYRHLQIDLLSKGTEGLSSPIEEVDGDSEMSRDEIVADPQRARWSDGTPVSHSQLADLLPLVLSGELTLELFYDWALLFLDLGEISERFTRLNPEQLTILVLNWAGELAIAQIAIHLGRSEDAVESAFRRALKKLGLSHKRNGR